MTWLIDDRGKTWTRQAHRIGRWPASDEPLKYAVAERGFVHLRISDGSLIIRANPRRTGRITLVTTFYFISALRIRRIALVFGPSGEQRTEIFGRIDEVIRRMEELYDLQPRERGEILWQRRRAFDRLGETVSPDVDGLVRIWQEMERRWTDERYLKLSAAQLLNTTLVVRNHSGSSRLVNSHWGAGVDLFGKRWTQIAVGKDVQDEPFPGPAKVAVSLYRQTLAHWEPSLYDVELAAPSENGTAMRYRYERLLLPWSSGGDRYVMNALFIRSRRPEQSEGECAADAVRRSSRNTAENRSTSASG